MTAGLPGAGMGALLYLLLVLILPFARRLLSERPAHSWRSIARQYAVAGGMLLIAWTETAIAEHFGFVSSADLIRRLPFYLLALAIIALELVRFAMRRKRGLPRENDCGR